MLPSLIQVLYGSFPSLIQVANSIARRILYERESCNIDDTHIIMKMGSISYHMPSSDVLEHNDGLHVPSLTKNLP